MRVCECRRQFPARPCTALERSHWLRRGAPFRGEGAPAPPQGPHSPDPLPRLAGVSPALDAFLSSAACQPGALLPFADSPSTQAPGRTPSEMKQKVPPSCSNGAWMEVPNSRSRFTFLSTEGEASIIFPHLPPLLSHFFPSGFIFKKAQNSSPIPTPQSFPCMYELSCPGFYM